VIKGLGVKFDGCAHQERLCLGRNKFVLSEEERKEFNFILSYGRIAVKGPNLWLKPKIGIQREIFNAGRDERQIELLHDADIVLEMLRRHVLKPKFIEVLAEVNFLSKNLLHIHRYR